MSITPAGWYEVGMKAQSRYGTRRSASLGSVRIAVEINLKSLAQYGARAKQTGLDRLETAPKYLSHLIIREALIVAQHYYLAIVVPQAADRIGQELTQLTVLRQPHGRHTAVTYLQVQFVLFLDINGRIKRRAFSPANAALSFQTVLGQVHRDSVKPRIDLGLATEGIPCAIGVDEGILGEVGCLLGIVDEAVDDVVHPLVVVAGYAPESLALVLIIHSTFTSAASYRISAGKRGRERAIRHVTVCAVAGLPRPEAAFSEVPDLFQLNSTLIGFITGVGDAELGSKLVGDRNVVFLIA